jgi:multicomponent Na+:H+ antiporter subunit G
MGVVLDIASWICLLAGSAFCMIGGLGLLRFPDVYARMHATGITDTLGTMLIVLGMVLQAGWTQVTVKLILILIFLLFTSPTATYALANAAHNRGLKPVLATDRDADGEAER